MSGGKMAAAELVKFSDADFEKTIQKMDLKDLLDAISVLQREMTREQANFNALSNELGMLNKNSRQYRQISKEMTVSQNKLTTLMDRSMKCFQQQGQQHITKQTESSTTVQRRNSSKETKDSSQMVPVQRRHSGKLPNTDAELIKSSMDKKTKSQPSTGGQPVILKPLSNVDNKNIAVKKPPAPGETRQDAVKAMQPANQTRVNGVDGSVSGQSKLQTNIINVSSTKTSVSNGDNSVRSSATFSFGGSKPSEQKPNSTKVVVNGSVERSDIKNSIISESRKPAASNLTKSGNVSNGGGESMYDARNKIFEEIKRFDKKSELTKAAPKPTQPVEVNLDFSASAPNKQPAPVVEKQEVKVQPSANVTRVKVSSQKQAVQKPDKPKTQVQVNQTQDKVIEMQDKVTRTQNLTKTETKTQNVTQAVKPVTKPQVKNQFDKLLSDKGESETDSDDDAQSPRRGEPEKFVSQVTFNHKPLNKVNSNVTVADVKLKKTEPVPKAGVTSTGASASSTKEPDAKYEGTIRMDEIDTEVDGEEEISPKHRNLKDWDPTKLLKELYAVKLMNDDAQDISDKFVFMEGLMEKLPMNKKKATLLKTWKRRFFRAKDGWLHYFETSSRDRPSDSLQLMGGRVDDLGNRILGVDDGRGRYLMVRCPTDKEYGQWKLALESQTADNVRSTYVKPVLSSPPNPKRKVIVIDIGSSGIRAGILGQQASLPQLFFPSIVARKKSSADIKVGLEAFTPEVRQTSDLMKAVRPTSRFDKDHMKSFNVDMEVMPIVFENIWRDLKIDPSQYWVMMSTPQNLADPLKNNMFEILVGKFKVKGICMVMQALLSLYSYNATSGIIVDIGQRMEILPIFDGYVIEGGVSRQSYGGQKVADSLNSSLTKNKYVFVTPVEQLIVRYVMEKSCYVTDDYKEKMKKCDANPESVCSTVYLNNFDLPPDAHMAITHDQSCFESPEGFFNTDLWGMDYPCVHKLVFQAIQTCPIDSRKHMYRSIFLSGGVTMIPGFAERLQAELTKLAPPSVIVEVHNSPQRYHAAYIGACALGNMDAFEQTCISAEEWQHLGVKAFKKWNMSPS